MPLPPNTRLGRYEIRTQIGAGGMGEVYLAEGTRLHRKVALKFLPADLASDGERRRRFEQEATSAATLNYPNIAHVYEIGEQDGPHFIAMECVDGRLLRNLMHRRQTELEKSYQQRDRALPRLKIDPSPDSMRDDPRSEGERQWHKLSKSWN